MKITEKHIDLLLEQAAIIRGSYLCGGPDAIDEDELEPYLEADMLDDLAEALVPLCDPPLSELAQECSHCESGVSCGSPCLSCRGTGSLPPMRDGKRLRLLPEAP